MLKEDILKWIATPTGLFVCSSVVTLSSTLAFISLPKVYHSIPVDKAEQTSSEITASNTSDTEDTESQVDMSPVRVDTETQIGMSPVRVDAETQINSEELKKVEEKIERIAIILESLPTQEIGTRTHQKIKNKPTYKAEQQRIIKFLVKRALKWPKKHMPLQSLEYTKEYEDELEIEQLVTQAVVQSPNQNEGIQPTVIRKTLIAMLSIAVVALYQLTTPQTSAHPTSPKYSAVGAATVLANNRGLFASYVDKPQRPKAYKPQQPMPEMTLNQQQRTKYDQSLFNKFEQQPTQKMTLNQQQLAINEFEQQPMPKKALKQQQLAINKFEQQPSMRAELTTIFQQPFIKKMGSLFEHSNYPLEIVATQLEVVATAWALPEVWHGLKGSQSYKPAGTFEFNL